MSSLSNFEEFLKFHQDDEIFYVQMVKAVMITCQTRYGLVPYAVKASQMGGFMQEESRTVYAGNEYCLLESFCAAFKKYVDSSEKPEPHESH